MAPERLTRAAEGLFVLAILVAPWPYGSAQDPARYGLSTCLLAAAGLWAASQAWAGRGVPRLTLPVAAGLVLGVLQLFVSSRSRVDTADALLVLAAMLSALLFWHARSAHGVGGMRLSAAVLVVCAAEAIFGAVQWQVAPSHLYGEASPIVTTPFGSYVNHNHFAGLMEMGAVLALGWALGLYRRRNEPSPAALGLLGLGLALVAAHLASRSRGGLVALAAGLTILSLLRLWASALRERGAGRSGRAGRQLALSALSVLLFLAFGLAIVPEQTRSHLGTLFRGSRDSSGAYRSDVARDTLRLATAHPLLGSGIGAYADAFTPFKRGHGDVRTTHAESDVLEFLAEAGLAGLLAVAWLAISLGSGFGQSVRHARNAVHKGLTLGAAAAVGALLVHSFVDFNLRIPANALVFASLAGMASASPARHHTLAGRGASILATVIALALAGAASWRAAGAVSLERARDVEDAQAQMAAYDAVIRRHPYLAEAWRERGRLWWTLAVRQQGLVPTRLVRAQGDLEAAVALRPQWGGAWADLAMVRFLQRDLAGAREALGRAAVADPSHDRIANTRRQLDGLLGLAP